VGRTIRLAFDRPLWRAIHNVRWRSRSDPALLHHVRQLVRHQPLPIARPRRVLPGAEDHVAPDGVSQGVHGLSRLGGPRVGVDAHRAEVLAEARFHKSTGRGVERPARRAQHVVDNWRGHFATPQRPAHRPVPGLALQRERGGVWASRLAGRRGARSRLGLLLWLGVALAGNVARHSYLLFSQHGVVRAVQLGGG
jgi:hypothetical protein